MTKQIAINLISGVSCTIRANPCIHSPANVITSPHRQKYAQTAFMVIDNGESKTTLRPRTDEP